MLIDICQNVKPPIFSPEHLVDALTTWMPSGETNVCPSDQTASGMEQHGYSGEAISRNMEQQSLSKFSVYLPRLGFHKANWRDNRL